MKHINTPYSIVIALLLIVLYTNCKSEPIDLDDPKSYPLKYTYSSFDYTAKPHLYLITSDKGDYKIIDEAPAYKKCYENYKSIEEDYELALDFLSYKSITLENDSMLNILNRKNEIIPINYKIEANNFLKLPLSYWPSFSISNNRKSITQYLRGVFYKRKGSSYPNYPIEFTHDKGNGNLDKSVLNMINGLQLTTSDTLFVGLIETKYNLK